jgi:hypothetical protein
MGTRSRAEGSQRVPDQVPQAAGWIADRVASGYHRRGGGYRQGLRPRPPAGLEQGSGRVADQSPAGTHKARGGPPRSGGRVPRHRQPSTTSPGEGPPRRLMRLFSVPRFTPSRSARAAVSMPSADRSAGGETGAAGGSAAGRGDRGGRASSWATASRSSAVAASSWATRSASPSGAAGPPEGAAAGPAMLTSQSRMLTPWAAAWARQ